MWIVFFLKEKQEYLRKTRQRPITQQQADSVANEIKAVSGKAYIVSSMTQQGLNEMMTTMVRAALVAKGVLKMKRRKAPEIIMSDNRTVEKAQLETTV